MKLLEVYFSISTYIKLTKAASCRRVRPLLFFATTKRLRLSDDFNFRGLPSSTALTTIVKASCKMRS